MTTINELADDSWQVAEDAGWHTKVSDSTEGICTRLALIHSEVSEAMETFRTNGTDDWISPIGGKPEGWASELADIIIRVCDLAVITDVDLEEACGLKQTYNAKRADVPSRFSGEGGKAF